MPRLVHVALLMVGLLISAGWMVPGAKTLGVLSCTVGRGSDPQPRTEAVASSEAREMICSFKAAGTGSGESYSAVVKSISTLGRLPERLTLMWLVRAPFGTHAKPGLLQQSYSIDPTAPPEQAATLTGEQNANISLQPMADKEPDNVPKEDAPSPRYVITSVELVLKLAIG